LGIAVAVLTFFVSAFSVRFVASADQIQFRVVLMLVGFDLALQLPVKAFSGSLIAELRYDVVTGVALVKLIVTSLLVAFILETGRGLQAAAGATFVVSILCSTSEAILARRLVQGLKFVPVRVAVIKSLFSYSLYTFFSQIADILRFRIDTL